MPSFERGVYEPQSDDVHVFDEDEGVDEEGSRLPLLIVIALLVLAAFAGVVWLAYSQGVQRGRTDAPRMIVAAPGPDKEVATNSDSGNGTDLKIYQQQAPVDEETDAAPQPKQPVPAPAIIAQTPVMSTAPAPVVAKPASKPEPSTSNVAAAKPATGAPKLLVIEKPKPNVVAQTQPSSNAVTIAPATEAPTAKAPAEKPVPAKVVSTSGAYALQIGAYKSQADADAAWKAYKAKHAIVGGYSEDVRRADLGDKGTWYRLRIGSFSDKDSAAAFCDKLKADSGNCFLAK